MAEDINSIFNDENLDNLKESVDYSRILVDNARELYKLNKGSSFLLFDGFQKSSLSLSRSLDKIASSYSRYLNFEISGREVKTQIVRLEKELNSLALSKEKLERDGLKSAEDKLKESVKAERLAQKEYNKGNFATREGLKEILKLKQKETTLSKDQLRALKVSLESIGTTESLGKKQVERLKEYNKLVDSSGLKLAFNRRLITTISKIPFIGPFVDVNKGLAAMHKSLILKEGFWKTLGGSVGGAFGSISKVAGILLAFEVAFKVFQFIKDSMFAANKQLTDIARRMNTTTEAAQGLRDQFISISKSVDALSQKDVYETWALINDQLGTAIKLDALFLRDMTVIKSLIGLSAEAMMGLTLNTRAGEKEVSKIITDITIENNLRKLQGKSLIESKKLLEDTLKITGYLVATFKGIPQELAKGVAQAHLMGTTLDKINSIADGFLDFESSISAELEAQLLTGRNINLDQARYFAMTNNISGLMDEINKNSLDWNTFTSMNRIAAEGIAKALGMSKDEMSNMIFQQETLNKLKVGGLAAQLTAEQRQKLSQIQTSQQAYDYLLKQKVAEQDIANLLGDRAYKNLQIISAEEKFTRALEKVKEAFSNLFTGDLIDKIASEALGFANALNKGIGYTILHGADEVKKAEAELAERSVNLSEYGQKELQKISTKKEYVYTQGGAFESGESINKTTEGVKLAKYIETLHTQGVSEAKIDELIRLFQTSTEYHKMLIDIVKEGKVINMEGYPVGTAISMASLKQQ